MPCYDSRSDGREEINELRQYLTQATRAACDLRTVLRRGGTEADLCLETLNWICEHDRQDAERIRREQQTGQRERARQAALDKLSLDDRRILGL